MSYISDLMLGGRPDMAMPDFMGGYIDDIREAGNVGLGRVGKYGRRDMKMARRGRIEEMGRLAPVIALLKAREGAANKDMERSVRATTAFEDQPYLTAAMLQEGAAKINENTSMAFGDAASDAYDDASDDFEGARRYRADMRMRAAMGKGQLAHASTYDRSRRPGGLLQGLIQSWLSPSGIAGAAGLFSGGGAKAPSPGPAKLPNDPWEVWG